MSRAVENPLPRSHVETVSRILSIVLLIAGGCYGVRVYLGSDPGVTTPLQERFAPASVPAQPKAYQTATQPPLIGTRTKGHVAPAAETGGNPGAQTDPEQQMAAVPTQDTLPAASAVQPATSNPAPAMQPTALTEAIQETAENPTGCLPTDLMAVLKDVQAKYGSVTLVSTTHLHTNNHSPGSTRERLHAACKAVDFQVRGNAQAIVAYLHSRPEVAGINVFRNNGVIHIDYNEQQGGKGVRTASNSR